MDAVVVDQEGKEADDPAAKATAGLGVRARQGPTGDDRGADKPWTTRRRLAYALLALLAIVVLASIAAMFSDLNLQRIKDVMTIVFGPVAGLVGAVVGFYFGAKTGSETPSGGADGAQNPES